MSQSIAVNGVTISYPETGDVDWGSEATNFAIQVAAALGKLGLGSGTTASIVGTLTVAGNTTLSANLTVSGDSAITGNQTVTGNETVTGNLTVNGNTTLGNANTDTIAVTGIVNIDSGTLYVDPVNNRVGINDTTPSEALDVTGNVAITGNETIGGTLGVIGNTTLTGQMLSSDGTASLPGISFSSDTNTGLYRIGADKIGIATNGALVGQWNTDGIQTLDNYALFNEEQNSGTDGGTFTAGAWRTRALNTDKTNRISGVSRSTNTISLPSGTYRVLGWGVATYVNRHCVRLFNVTDSTTLLSGVGSFSTSTANVQSMSIVFGEFTISATKNIELQHQCQTTSSSIQGFGFAQGASFTVDKEIYSQLHIWKIA
jgi:hypothetical protein